MDDIDLVEQYLSGNEKAFEELIMKYQKKIYGLAYRMTRDIEESKDITQSTFLQAIRYVSGFRNKSSFKTWLYKITYNLSLNHLNKRKKHEAELSESIIGNECGALGILLEKERGYEILKALSGVPDRQRLSIILRTYEGLSCRETAEIMNISEGAVKANYHNGLKKMKVLIGKKGYDSGS
ncbi:MAG: RNA polymerase sigma factor [Nitrospiraceae bacterium]|nr:MAG: RNA polymerase sigma factor [Nitrospiraceae bacterium]